MEIMFTEPMVRSLMRLAYTEGVAGCEELADSVIDELLRDVIGLSPQEPAAPPPAPMARPMRAANRGMGQAVVRRAEDGEPQRRNAQPILHVENPPPDWNFDPVPMAGREIEQDL